MSAIIILPGRPTTDPQIMQAKNSNTTYTTLDVACPQRGQDGKNETIFYSCYFNAFLADRLIKAGVKKGTGLIIYGELELHPFIHQKGKNQGKPNSGPSVTVKDWQFAPTTYTDENGANSGIPRGVPQNGYGQPGVTPGVPNQQVGYPSPAQGNYPQTAGAPTGNYIPTGSMPQNQNGYAPGSQGAYVPTGSASQNNYGQPTHGYTPNHGNTPNYTQEPQNPQTSGSYTPTNGTAPGAQGSYQGDGFTQIPEQQAGKLPFVA